MKIVQYALVGVAMVLVAGCGGSSDAPEGGAQSSGQAAAAEKGAAAPVRHERQILETAELMKLLVDPIYEELKDAIEVAPEGRKAWRALYIAAFNIAETNNLLFSREDEDYMKTPEWTKESLEALELGITLGESVRSQADYEVMKANYLAVVENCNQCHRLFEPGEVDEIEVPPSWGEEVEEDPDKIVIQ